MASWTKSCQLNWPAGVAGKHSQIGMALFAAGSPFATKEASSVWRPGLPATRAYLDNRVTVESLVHLVNKPEADESADRTEDH